MRQADARARAARRAACALLVGVVALTLACGTRYSRVVLHDQDDTRVVLRAEIRDGERFDRGYAHPVTISGIRIAHVLSRIDVRLSSASEQSGDRRPAIHTSLIYPLGSLLSEAFAKADPSQEVVVQAIRKERNLGIFTQSFLTSFVAYVEGDRLVIHLSRVDWQVPKGDEDDLKEPVVGREVMRFKALATEGIEPVAQQSIVAYWRDPMFRKASNIRVGPTGKVMRRTILLEGAAEDPADTAEAERPATVPTSPEALRELADLEEARRSGAITEAEYHRRRAELLRGP